MTKRAAIYCRISEDKEGLGLGVKRQEDDCVALVNRNGWEVIEIFTDNDISAYSGKLRPKYKEMVSRINDKEFDVVVVWHNDRLHRSPRELEDFIDLCEKTKITVQTVQAGLFDLGTSSGRATARILGAVARQSSEQSSDRIKRKNLEVAMAGKPWGKKQRTYGHTECLSNIVEEEARAIQIVAKRFLAGESLYSLAKWLNENNYRTIKGGTFSTKAIRDILKSARISSRREYAGEIVGKGTWPQIISHEESDAIRAKFKNRSSKNFVNRKYLLTGLLRCGLCGAKLVGCSGVFLCRKNPRTGEGCSGIYLTSSHTEKFITEAVLTRLNSPRLIDYIKSKAVNTSSLSAHSELTTISEKEIELAEMFGVGELSRVELGAAKAKLNKRKFELERVLSKEMGAISLGEDLGSPEVIVKKWASLNLDRQRVIVKAVLEFVNVQRAKSGINVFDPSRLEPVWKF